MIDIQILISIIYLDIIIS